MCRALKFMALFFPSNLQNEPTAFYTANSSFSFLIGDLSSTFLGGSAKACYYISENERGFSQILSFIRMYYPNCFRSRTRENPNF